MIALMIMLNLSQERIFNPNRYIGTDDLLRRNEDGIEIIVNNFNAFINKLTLNPRSFRNDGRCHNLKIGKTASEVTEESPAGCAGDGKQNKINR